MKLDYVQCRDYNVKIVFIEYIEYIEYDKSLQYLIDDLFNCVKLVIIREEPI